MTAIMQLPDRFGDIDLLNGLPQTNSTAIVALPGAMPAAVVGVFAKAPLYGP
jgi:hypothetical protein